MSTPFWKLDQLPFDILFYIFKKLSINDLIQLSRVNKTLRAATDSINHSLWHIQMKRYFPRECAMLETQLFLDPSSKPNWLSSFVIACKGAFFDWNELQLKMIFLIGENDIAGLEKLLVASGKKEPPQTNLLLKTLFKIIGSSFIKSQEMKDHLYSLLFNNINLQIPERLSHYERRDSQDRKRQELAWQLNQINALPVDCHHTDNVAVTFWAAGFGSTELLKLVLSENPKQEFLQYHASCAATFGHVEVMKILNQNNALDRDNFKEELLCKAASAGRLEVVKYLISINAKIDHVVLRGSLDHTTPIHEAAKNGQLHILYYFKQQQADINMRDKNMHTPLMQARNYNTRCAESLRKAGILKDINELMIKLGANANEVNPIGNCKAGENNIEPIASADSSESRATKQRHIRSA